MDITDKEIESMKDLARKSGKEYTDAEAREAAHNLHRFADLMWKIAKEHTARDRRLKKEPDGFPVDSTYSCCVCGNSINSETGWYDKYGAKCPLCRKAVADGTIPTFVCTNRDSYLSMWTLTSDLKVRSQTIKKFIKEGKLNARVVLNEQGNPHCYIFLRKENPDLTVPNNPSRKSYDKHRDKLSKKWVKETTAKWKADFKKRYKK